MSFASAADHQASSAIVSKQTLMSKIYTQSHFVQMLQTVPVSSNFEVIIMFTRRFAIDPWVNDEYFLFIKFLLQQLTLVYRDLIDLQARFRLFLFWYTERKPDKLSAYY